MGGGSVCAIHILAREWRSLRVRHDAEEDVEV
jgi:hypothetical protein